MTRIEQVYQNYAESLYREHPLQFQKAKDWMETWFHGPRMRF